MTTGGFLEFALDRGNLIATMSSPHTAFPTLEGFYSRECMAMECSGLLKSQFSMPTVVRPSCVLHRISLRGSVAQWPGA